MIWFEGMSTIREKKPVGQPRKAPKERKERYTLVAPNASIARWERRAFLDGCGLSSLIRETMRQALAGELAVPFTSETLPRGRGRVDFTDRIQFRVSKAETELWEKFAKKQSLPVAEVLRQTLDFVCRHTSLA